MWSRDKRDAGPLLSPEDIGRVFSEGEVFDRLRRTLQGDELILIQEKKAGQKRLNVLPSVERL